MNEIKVECPSFSIDREIPVKHTGFGEDITPEFLLTGVNPEVKSLAIVMDDLDIPFLKELNHWLIWNLPVSDQIVENIPYGANCLNGAKQGIGYGKHRYRGPKQPPFIKAEHRYRFTIYGLDCILDLPVTSRKRDLLKAMKQHILQRGEIIGRYKP